MRLRSNRDTETSLMKERANQHGRDTDECVLPLPLLPNVHYNPKNRVNVNRFQIERIIARQKRFPDHPITNNELDRLKKPLQKWILNFGINNSHAFWKDLMIQKRKVNKDRLDVLTKQRRKPGVRGIRCPSKPTPKSPIKNLVTRRSTRRTRCNTVTAKTSSTSNSINANTSGFFTNDDKNSQHDSGVFSFNNRNRIAYLNSRIYPLRQIHVSSIQEERQSSNSLEINTCRINPGEDIIFQVRPSIKENDIISTDDADEETQPPLPPLTCGPKQLESNFHESIDTDDEEEDQDMANCIDESIHVGTEEVFSADYSITASIDTDDEEEDQDMTNCIDESIHVGTEEVFSADYSITASIDTDDEEEDQDMTNCIDESIHVGTEEVFSADYSITASIGTDDEEEDQDMANCIDESIHVGTEEVFSADYSITASIDTDDEEEDQDMTNCIDESIHVGTEEVFSADYSITASIDTDDEEEDQDTTNCIDESIHVGTEEVFDVEYDIDLSMDIERENP